MPDTVHCDRCGSRLPGGAGLCAACLLEFGVEGYPEEHPGAPPANRPPPVRVLGECGDYELLEEIARGGMGVVCRARQKSLNRIVAVKLILNGHWAGPNHTERFRAETEAAARLDHPNIVPIYETGVDLGQHFFSMKFIAGSSLANVIAARAPRSGEMSQQREWARVLAIIARAVHYAHQRSVLHRDLKPTNILMDAAGQPHLTDFGLAKLLDQDSQLTHSASVLGTPSYMAPERAGGPAELVTTAADIYSLGAILYAMLTGRPPFVGDTPLQTLERVRNAEPVPPRLRQPGVDPDLETICLKCLSKEPDQRYGSAEALAGELERFLHGEPIQARPVGALDQFARWSRRQPALAGLSLALLLALLSGLAVSAWQWRRARLAYVAEQTAYQQLQSQNELLRLQRAQSLLERNEINAAFPVLAQMLRLNPSNRLAAEMLAGHLGSQRLMSLPTQLQSIGNGLASLWFSPDGGSLAGWARDAQSFALFPVVGGKLGPPRIRMPVEADVVAASFSHDAQVLFVGLANGVIRRFDTASGATLDPPLEVRQPLAALGFAEERRQLLSVTRPGALVAWGEGGSSNFLTHLGELGALVNFSPDARHLAGLGADGQIRVWKIATGKCVVAVPAPVGLRRLEWSPNNQWLGLVRDSDGLEVLSLDHPDGTLQHEAWRRTAPVEAVAFSADGTRVASAHGDLALRQWRLADGLPAADPILVRTRLRQIAFVKADQGLVTQDENGTVQVWDALAGRVPVARQSHVNTLRGWAVDAARGQVASGTFDGTIFLMESHPPTPHQILLRRGGSLAPAAFSLTGDLAATADDSGRVQVWNSANGTPVGGPLVHPRPVTHCEFSPDGKKLATACADGAARVWDARGGKELTPPLRPADAVLAVGFSPDGQAIVTVAQDYTAQLWNLRGEPTSPPLQHGNQIVIAEFSPDGRSLATAGYGRKTQLWSVPKGRLLSELPTSAAVSALRFRPDGRQVVAGHFNGYVRLWNLPEAELAPLVLQRAGQVTAVAFSPDGQYLARGATDAQVVVWSLRETNLVPRLLRQESPVTGITFTPDSLRLITSGEDGAVQLWDVATGLRLALLARQRTAVRTLQLDREGRRLQTAALDGTVLIQRLPRVPLPVPAWFPELAESLTGVRLDAQGNEQRWYEWAFALDQFLAKPPADDFGREIWALLDPAAARRESRTP